MDTRLRRLHEGRAKTIKALAHPSRLYIVDLLAEQECCVNELTDLIGCDMSTVSRHLGILKNAGIVIDEKRGQRIYYSLRSPRIRNILKYADEVIAAFRQNG